MKGLIPNQWIWLPGLGAWKCVLGRYFYVGHADNVEKPRIENHTYIGTQSRIGKFVRVRVGTNEGEGEDEGEFHRTVSIGIVNKNQNKDSQL